MAQNDGVSTTILRYEVDQASISSVTRSVATIQNNFKVLEGNVGSVSQTTKNLQVQLDALKRASAIDQLTREFVAVGKSAKDFDGALISLRQGLRDVGASSSEIKQATDAFRELEIQAQKANASTGGGVRLEGLRRTGSALNQLGLGAIGEPIQRIGDIGQVAKEFESIGTSLGLIAPAAEGAASGTIAFTSAMLPVAAIGAATAAAFIVISKALEQSRVEAEKQVAILNKYYDALRAGNVELTKRQISETENNIAYLKQKQKDLAGTVTNTLNNPNLGFAQKGIDALFGGTKVYGDELAKTNAELEKAQNDLTALNKALPILESTAKLFGTVGGGLDIMSNAAEKFLDLAKKNAAAALAQEANAKKYGDAIAEDKRTSAITAAEKQAADEKAFRDKQNSELASAAKKYADAEKKAVEDERSAEADIRQKYAAKVADVLQQAIDEADAALAKLHQREADILTGASRAEEKDNRKQDLEDTQAQIKARRQERDDLQDHLRKVRDIQKRFASDERDALLDRNFLQLFKLQENKKEQTDAENTAYSEQKADREQAIKDEQEDTKRRRIFEANERHYAIQEALADARAGYQRELAAAAQKRDRALQIAAQERDAAIHLAQQKYINTINIAIQTATEEVRLASLSSEARKMILWEEVAQAKQILASMGVYMPSAPVTQGPGSSNPGTISGGTTIPRLFASGGDFGPGTVGVINEGRRGQRERINGVRMPPGIGLFVSTGSGSVTQDKPSIGSLSIPITINEARTPRETYRVAKQAAIDAMKQVMGA